MATSKCKFCESTTFELKENEPKGSAFKYVFIQCASCGAVVGVVDCFNIGDMLEKQAFAIKKIAKALNVSL